MPRTSDYVNAVDENEPATTNDVIDALGVSEGHAQKKLKELAERGDCAVYRERGAHGFVYYTADEASGTTQADAGLDDDGNTLMPVNRGYDFSDHGVQDVNEYYATNGELRRLNARVNGTSGEPVRALIGGHTGTGKTTLAANVAATAEAAYFEVAMRDDMNDGGLFGSPTLAGDSTLWVDGTVTKALMASASPERQVAEGWAADADAAHDGPVVLLIDELNRAPAKAKNALFAALDHRCTVTLDGPRGGEVIRGDAENLIVLATINEGNEYHGTHRMDAAEVSRWTNRYESGYLATYDVSGGEYEGVEQEAELLASRQGVPAAVARDMSRVAAEVRAEATDPTNTTINVGLSTRNILAWAASALDYAEAGVDNAIVEAAKDSIMSAYASPGDEDAYDEVLAFVEDAFNGAPLDAADYEAHTADELVRCGSCSWSMPKPQAEAEGHLALWECPTCGDDIDAVRR